MTNKQPWSVIKKGIIFVCNNCLKEVVVAQKDFFPDEVERMTDEKGPAKGWQIPALVQICEEKMRYYKTPSSNVISYCPKCKKK